MWGMKWCSADKSAHAVHGDKSPFAEAKLRWKWWYHPPFLMGKARHCSARPSEA